MKHIYTFEEGSSDLKNLLGGKGANLSEMSKLGLPIPSGFVITTETCKEYLLNKNELDNEVVNDIIRNIRNIESHTGKKFGGNENILLFSVRSGAPISMPGMMDTILNLGLNDHTVVEFAKQTSDDFMAYSCYHRLIQMFGNVVKNIPVNKFEQAANTFKSVYSLNDNSDYTIEMLVNLTNEYKKVYQNESGEPFPQNVGVQLISAIEAVFDSWNNDRAITYREIHNISHEHGTAAVVQEMVFGNLNDQSATGVVFSRNPNTGEEQLYGEFLLNAQGEDIVDGSNTPQNIEELKSLLPNAYSELEKIAHYLESHFKDMQDIEFTIENGKLFILQTRNAKRSSKAKVVGLLELYNNEQITKNELIMKLDIEDIEAYIFDSFDDEALDSHQLFATGLPASSGAATGVVCLNDEAVDNALQQGQTPILFRKETSAEDISSMHKSAAIVTALGGMTSHAAVVARGMGKCCVCGVNSLVVDEFNHKIYSDDLMLNEGDFVSVDGATGSVYIGEVGVKSTKLDKNFVTIMNIIDSVKELKVYANADEGDTISKAIEYGAEGIGLVRTEHMFFNEERLPDMQLLIMSRTREERIEYLRKLSKYQIEDFTNLLNVAGTRPVAIRLLDPPLHEFLPTKLHQANKLAESLGLSLDEVKDKIRSLKEVNPMLGHRGCRLAITYPEIYQMQVESIVSAVVSRANRNLESDVKIIIPFITEENELIYLSKLVKLTTARLLKGSEIDIKIQIGAMIETPRAALISERLSKHVDYFSYGTNDLTQFTYGFSRDDVAKFIPTYFEKNIIKTDPFSTIDKVAVGKLLVLSNQFGKVSNPDLITGICGEHGGDFESVKFAYNIGLDYVSCSPKRIPVAKLAAAQAVVEVGESNEK